MAYHLSGQGLHDCSVTLKRLSHFQALRCPMRTLAALPKAYVHLHLTARCARRRSPSGPPATACGFPHPCPPVSTPWLGVFQERYDAADGAGWVELQLDPTSFAGRLGGAAAVVGAVLEAAGLAARRFLRWRLACTRLRRAARRAPDRARDVGRLRSGHCGLASRTRCGAGGLPASSAPLGVSPRSRRTARRCPFAPQNDELDSLGALP